MPAVTAYWLGTAQKVTQVTTITITAYDVGTTYKILCNNKIISCIAQGSDTATAAKLQLDLSTSNEPEFREFTTTVSTTVLTLTSNSPGVPFTVTTAATGATGTMSISTVAADGPNFWSTAANWLNSAGTNLVPVSTDTVYLDGLVPVRYGLAQSAVTLAALYGRGNVEVGLPPTTASGYAEYRPQYLAIGATLIEIDSSASMIAINTGTVQTTMNVYNTGTPTQGQTHALRFLGTHASNALNIFSGSVGIAERPSEVATVLTCKVGSGQGGSPSVYIGTGGTLGTFTIASGTVESHSNITTVTCQGGTLVTREATTLGTVSVRKSGVLRHQSSGTITTLNAGPDGQVDMSRDLRARTVTNANLYAGTKINDRYKTVAWTNGLILTQCGLADVTLDLGTGITLTVA